MTLSKLDMGSHPRVMSLLPGSRVAAWEMEIGFSLVTLLLATPSFDLLRKMMQWPMENLVNTSLDTSHKCVLNDQSIYCAVLLIVKTRE